MLVRYHEEINGEVLYAGNCYRNAERLALYLYPGDPAAGGGIVFHPPYPACPAADVPGDLPHPAGEEQRRRLLFPGADDLHGLPGGHRQHCRGVHCHLPGRHGGGVLDVGGGAAGCRLRLCGEHPGPDLQGKGRQRVPGRPGLLHADGAEKTLDGRAVFCSDDHLLCLWFQRAAVL